MSRNFTQKRVFFWTFQLLNSKSMQNFVDFKKKSWQENGRIELLCKSRIWNIGESFKLHFDQIVFLFNLIRHFHYHISLLDWKYLRSFLLNRHFCYFHFHPQFNLLNDIRHINLKSCFQFKLLLYFFLLFLNFKFIEFMYIKKLAFILSASCCYLIYQTLYFILNK